MDVIIGRCLLQEVLDRKRISRTYLMDRTGMSKQQVSNYINNQQFMSLTTALKVSHVCKCKIEELYEWQVIE